jgi:hypothetical protein
MYSLNSKQIRLVCGGNSDLIDNTGYYLNLIDCAKSHIYINDLSEIPDSYTPMPFWIETDPPIHIFYCANGNVYYLQGNI